MKKILLLCVSCLFLASALTACVRIDDPTPSQQTNSAEQSSADTASVQESSQTGDTNSQWANNSLTQGVPYPNFGNMSSFTASGSGYLSVYIANASEQQARDYANQLREAGFTNSQSERSSFSYYYFQGTDANGKFVCITYSGNGLSIAITKY